LATLLKLAAIDRGEIRLAHLVLAISVLTLNGCAVGVTRVSVPPRLPPEGMRSVTRPITFDVCIPPNIQPRGAFERERREQGEKIRSALSRVGVSAELKSTAESPVDFTITRHAKDQGVWSVFLSFATLSVLPGYMVSRGIVDVDLAWIDAARVRKDEHLQYESRATTFVWLPLIFYPDFFVGLNGGWESSNVKKRGEAAEEQLFERLGEDIRTRLGRNGEAPPTGRGVRIGCPKPPPLDSSAVEQDRRTWTRP
jgi:hypothetical protein